MTFLSSIFSNNGVLDACRAYFRGRSAGFRPAGPFTAETVQRPRKV